MKINAILAGIGLTVTLAACGSSSTGGAAAGRTTGGHGTVTVLYAGSLENLMERDLGPAFARADGYAFEGFGAGSTELVAQIKGGIRRGDVFISASPKANKGLEGPGNGNWSNWYVAFARAPLVIGYNPQSKFASQFRSRPWYEVITQPGIRVGITDPKLDPKGKLTVAALNGAAAALRMPSLAHALSKFTVFPEETLVGRLEAGQLDAGFFYTVEAKDQHIPTVALAPIKQDATYTVTILKGAPDPQAARAFVSFLLGATGRALLRRHGLTVTAPTLTGSSAAAPANVRALIGG
jgi:molybdate/tungstate transport system substrate-binding protein